MIFESGTLIYADSLGLVYSTRIDEAPSARNEELIYYHKANGKSWGQRNTNVGVHDIASGPAVSIYPNPSTGKFIVNIEHSQNAIFELYDLLGKKVMVLPLSKEETEISGSYLPHGIFYWQVTADSQSIKTGKLIIE